MVHLLAEWSDTKSNLKSGRFRSQLQVSYVSIHTDELGYNETVCMWMTIYIVSVCVCLLTERIIRFFILVYVK